MSRTEKILAELIALPSVNPAFAPAAPAPNRYGEKNVADFLMSVAASAGLEVEFQKVLPNRYNVIARLLPKNRIKQTIVLAPHMDTVDAEPSRFTPRKSNGRMHGRGACDTKGSVAAMLTALCEVAESKSRPQDTELVFVGLVDEENVQAGSRTLAKSGFKAALAIVGEPTRCRVVNAHKGSLWLQMETHGRAAHGAKPHLGKNAIHMMSRVVEVLETTYATQLKKRKHKLLGHATVNVGTITGGKQPNIVPDHCTISIDRRTLPGETEASVCSEINTLLRAKKLPAKISALKLAPAPALETSLKLPLVCQFFDSLGQTTPVGVDYFCDAAVLAAGGIPSVVFGPGDISQGHTADEWISLAELERSKRLLVRFFKSLP